MAYIRCESGGSGGSITETSLWINPDMTANHSSAWTVNLSDDINNYLYLKLRYRSRTTKPDKTMTIMMDVADFKKQVYGSTTDSCWVAFFARGGENYSRRWMYESDTSCSFSGISNGYNYCIPEEIIGIK